MDIFEDVDDKLFVFETLFTEILDEHAPIKQFHVRGKFRIWLKSGEKQYATEIDYRKSSRKIELLITIIYTKLKETNAPPLGVNPLEISLWKRPKQTTNGTSGMRTNHSCIQRTQSR